MHLKCLHTKGKEILKINYGILYSSQKTNEKIYLISDLASKKWMSQKTIIH